VHDDDKCQDGEGAQHVILPLWQALYAMIAKGCSPRKPGRHCPHRSQSPS